MQITTLAKVQETKRGMLGILKSNAEDLAALRTLKVDGENIKVLLIICMDLKAHYIFDRLPGATSIYFCAFCTAEKKWQHLTPALVRGMRGAKKTEAEAALAKIQRRSTTYAMEAAKRTEVTTTIYYLPDLPLFSSLFAPPSLGTT